MYDVDLIFEGQYGDLAKLGVDDPVFGDSGLGILLAFSRQVAAASFVARANDLHHQVGTLPVIVGDAVGMFRVHEHDVGLSVLSGPETDAYPYKENFAEIPCGHEQLQGVEQERGDPLMTYRENWQELEKTVGKLQPAVGFELEVLALAISALSSVRFLR
jgi:hypothetical protein